MHDAVLALLTNLLEKKSQDIDIDDRTSIFIKELSEHLTRLGIIEMRITRNDLSSQAIVVTDLECREIVIASLTSFELMSSIADLIAHLLSHMKE
jgi:dihydroorotase